MYETLTDLPYTFAWMAPVALVMILAVGCTKSPDAALSLKPGVSPAPSLSTPSFELPNSTGRVIAFDDDDGTGLSCLLSYDVNTGTVELSHVSGSTITNLWSTQGLIETEGTYPVTSGTSPVTDNYNEVGGVHLLAYDYTGSGHKDHILAYIPGTGYWALFSISNITTGVWNEVSFGTSGIGGYNLTSPYDKIITYELNGTGPETALIAYRPGSGNCWVIQNQSTGSTPTWVAVVKGSGGIGGFDLKGVNDQLVAVDYNPGSGEQNLVAYRPGYGYIWYLSHASNSTTWTTQYSTRSGFTNFACNKQQDRIIAYDANGANQQNYLLCYSPGNAGAEPTVVNGISTGDPIGPTFSSVYPMSANPYPGGGTGDHVLGFEGNGSSWGFSSLLAYTNGNNEAYLFDESIHGVNNQGEEEYTLEFSNN